MQRSYSEKQWFCPCGCLTSSEAFVAPGRYTHTHMCSLTYSELYVFLLYAFKNDWGITEINRDTFLKLWAAHLVVRSTLRYILNIINRTVVLPLSLYMTLLNDQLGSCLLYQPLLYFIMSSFCPSGPPCDGQYFFSFYSNTVPFICLKYACII